MTKDMISRRAAIVGAAVAGAAPVLSSVGLPGHARAQANKTIRVIYPFAAGSIGDTLARILAEKIATALPATVIVENRTGAAGRIGVKMVVAAVPDGTTLLFTSSPTVAIYPHSYPQLDYDPDKDLTPISLAATFDVALAVSAQSNIKTMQELVAWAKANPGLANYGSPGAGGLGHFIAVMVAISTGIDLKHVTYRGSGAVMTDLISGQIPIAVVPLGDALEMHRSGRARVLATSGAQRSPLLPDAPTFKEAGINAEGQGWYALYAPAQTPADVVAAINKATIEGLAAPDVREKVLRLNMVPQTTSPAGLTAFRDADSARWAPAVKASGFKPQQ